MDRNRMMSWLSGTLVLAIVVVICIISFIRTRIDQNSVIADTDSLQALEINKINQKNLSTVNDLQNYANLPLLLNPEEFGRDDPFAGV
jgi:hypothetical protein